MGFEYKIVTKLTDNQAEDIFTLLELNVFFDKKYPFDNKEFWDFRHPENKGRMPNITLTIEQDGIYICQNSSPYLWSDLDTLKNFIEQENIEHIIIDYSE